jgi:hypothetical protein
MKEEMAIFDIPSAFLHANMAKDEKIVHMVLDRKMTELFT